MEVQANWNFVIDEVSTSAKYSVPSDYLPCDLSGILKKVLGSVGRLENLRDMPMPCHLFWHSFLPTHTFSNVMGTERSILFLSCEQQHTSETSQAGTHFTHLA